jgi:hypothetical protein
MLLMLGPSRLFYTWWSHTDMKTYDISTIGFFCFLAFTRLDKPI